VLRFHVFDDVFLEAREVFHSRYREVLIVRVDAAKDVVFQTVLCDVRTRKRERERVSSLVRYRTKKNKSASTNEPATSPQRRLSTARRRKEEEDDETMMRSFQRRENDNNNNAQNDAKRQTIQKN